jgi:N-acetyl-anhydromuramyl-L-alanine amidase AmpD
MKFFQTSLLLLLLLAAQVAQAQQPVIQKDFVSFGFKKQSTERKVKALIIHSCFNASYPSTAAPDTFSFSGVVKQFADYGVSAHYVIDREGNIHQLVKLNDVAFHAGKSQLPDGTTSVNSCSIGIEIMCTYTVGPNAAQYDALTNLVRYLDSTYSFKYILGHSEIAPGRKTDPWKFKDPGIYRK